jgi:uncharacterized protein (TIGR02466 family)
MNRQQRRKQEKTSNPKSFELPMDLLQPWSVPVMRTKLPQYVLDGMIELTDDMIADENSISHGPGLVGQIKTELTVDVERLKKNNLDKFFDTMIKQFVIHAKTQKSPHDREEIQNETWLSQILSMWVVSQNPGEYNPIHFHPSCHISAVMYLKIPKWASTEKQHRSRDDGSITFVSNASLDREFSDPTLLLRPELGDFFVFGSNQLHQVYPYHCDEGDTERRSVSFNAIFSTESVFEQQKKNLLESQSHE